ncbi:MAG: threonine--tRNA ligase [Candidatus Puniceispirillales bacterium]|jgi:threonyl-tRNA synthetase|nr:threonine--tRNA ligase [Alphaproteobacteria bacterium]MBL6851057.1 threonine--tRNA ligase [Alphaproteobacteria bacterium]
MLTITLPNEDKKNYKNPVTSLQIAEEISPRLAADAFIAEVNGELWDLNRLIEKDSSVAILTSKNIECLDLIRHDAAHIMAEAVLELFPETQVTIGPSIENGFYYDFYREKKFNLTDLEIIEQRMHEIVNRDEKITREVWTRGEALSFFEKNNEKFKVELVNAIPGHETVTFYRQGNFIDLCRGPHSPSTKKLGHSFKLTKLAGAYWRGDSKNPVLQRIYGTAFLNDKDLKNYLLMIEEAEKRDHRKIGKELNLFHLQEEAVGSVFWHKKGWSIYLEIESYMRRKLSKSYEEVKTPQVIDRTLWEKSGHWDKFQEHMFMAKGDDEKVLALKPMNCPGHVQIYKQGLKSYKDLPIRMAEFGSCHRNEPSGALHGIMRVRQFTQDDAHIFCMNSQITEECVNFCELLQQIYKDFGFAELKVKFSDRPEIRAGDDQTWDKAEEALLKAIKAAGINFTLNPGEGAFYGPKLEFVLTDAIGRDWQCGTLQVDFVLPERLDAYYIDADGQKKHPVMLHRAILGSLERWIGILIEQYSGRMPLWLAPTQVAVCSIVDSVNDYILEIKEYLDKNGIRNEIDIRNEKIGYKIREHSNNAIPIIIVIGNQEKENKTVAVRYLGSKNQEVLELEQFVANVSSKCLAPDMV